VRPITGNCTYEIVAGERRFRASGIAGKETIPAIVRELSDEEAFDAMTIENLQREDLTEYEEAMCFKEVADVKGDAGIHAISERTGIDERYIRRRLRILTLPKEVLDAWDKGKILYGHCEQLMRLSRKEQIMGYLKEILDGDRWSGEMTVKDLKGNIDNLAIEIKIAKFDMKQCKQCTMNSTVQVSLFGDICKTDKARCLNPACFKKKQGEWFNENWKTTQLYREYKTNGCRFYGDTGDDKWEAIHYDKKTLKDSPCVSCKDFISLIRLGGDECYNQVCIGDKSCRDKVLKAIRSEGGTAGTSGRSVKRDHAPEFQDRFYREAIRKIIYDTYKSDFLDNEKVLRLIAYILIHSDGHATSNFIEGKKLKEKWGDSKEIWAELEKIYEPELSEWIAKTSLFLTLDNHQIAQFRECDNLHVKHLIAKHIGIDLARDWRITKDYLQSKTIAEIVALGKELKIFDAKEIKVFAQGTLKMKSENWAGMKKKDLVRLFLESGLDLAGKVPKEILKVK
jgi:ParB/RepB/Spo0J family partition protein